MTTEQKQLALRRKVLAFLSRARIEEISGLERPWLSSRRHLEDCILENWMQNVEDVRDEIKHMLKKAGIDL